MDDAEKQAVLDAHEGTLNECAAESCEIQLSSGRSFCQRHWHLLPPEIQRKVMDPVNPPDGPRHKTMREAVYAIKRAEHKIKHGKG